MTRDELHRGVAWVGVATAMVALCDLVAFVIIVRHWVTVEELGVVTMAVTVFGALQLAVEAGLPAAVVQRPALEEDPRRLSTIFWLGLGFGVAAYAIVWSIAPLVARLYDRPIMASLYRTVGLLLLVRPLYTTHNALLRSAKRFEAMSKVRIVANIVELVVKIGTAAWLGLWCFAIAPVARELTYAIGIPLQRIKETRWRPVRAFELRRITADLRYGRRVSAGELLYQIYSNADYQVVGIFFGEAAVGFYRAAYELVLEPVRFISGVVTSVAHPVFRDLASDRPALIDQLVAFTRQNAIVVLMFVGVIVVSADDLLTVLVKPEYAAAATAARILAIVGVLRCLSLLGPPLLDGLGRPGRSLRYHVVAAVTLGTAYLACGAAGTSYNAIAVAWALGYPIAFAALAYMVLARLELPATEYLRRLAPVAGAIAVAVVCGFAARIAGSSLAPLPRLLVSTSVLIGTGLALLARYAGFSPRAIVHSLRRR